MAVVPLDPATVAVVTDLATVQLNELAADLTALVAKYDVSDATMQAVAQVRQRALDSWAAQVGDFAARARSH
eukprot:4101176-Prymnesium_polylepis.1